MTTPLVAVSLKAYLGAAQTRVWLGGVRALADAGRVPADVELAVLPSMPLLPAAVELLSGTHVAWGAQDVAPGSGGAQTGAVTAALLAELGCRFAAVGHAERRSLFRETDADVRAKVARLKADALTPIVCVGEVERIGARAAAVAASDQLAAALAGTEAGEVVVAYEPVWAIGAPQPAGGDHVAAVAHAVRERMQDLGWRGRVLYGGAAGPGTLGALGASVDGLFLGRFAHDLGALAEVLDEARTAAPRAVGAGA
ncbi:triose-phosphate isomerase family protein [Xylanimonas ulmi]|uniref:Triosephosphate isomerase n=1 Tax=Xylanimonas ulmi TaxID=228973 RepID=A0A4Q7M8H2_9MICO|nr:triose-phosphate isomerase family protein [Xylanibacterium ulmi]RZS62982.1 triosephosphate isomerase [Xylanibacterium ulmi]